MVSVKRIVLRIVTSNMRNEADTHRPKGKEVVFLYHEAEAQMDLILSVQLTIPKTFIIICIVELGKPYVFLLL